MSQEFTQTYEHRPFSSSLSTSPMLFSSLEEKEANT